MTDYLYVHPVKLVSSVPPAFQQFSLHQTEQVFIQDILVLVIHAVVQVNVIEGIEIEEHLVVGAEPMTIDAQQSELGQYIVN